MEPPTVSADEWSRRFVARLAELHPAITPAESADVARVAHESASDLAPEEAAQVFGEVLNARVPVHDLKRWAGAKTGRR